MGIGSSSNEVHAENFVNRVICHTVHFQVQAEAPAGSTGMGKTSYSELVRSYHANIVYFGALRVTCGGKEVTWSFHDLRSTAKFEFKP